MKQFAVSIRLTEDLVDATQLLDGNIHLKTGPLPKGRYMVFPGLRCVCDEGSWTAELVTEVKPKEVDAPDVPCCECDCHEAEAVLDENGQVCWIYGDDNVGTDACEMPSGAFIVNVKEGSTLGLRFVTSENRTVNLKKIQSRHSHLTLLKID